MVRVFSSGKADTGGDFIFDSYAFDFGLMLTWDQSPTLIDNDPFRLGDIGYRDSFWYAAEDQSMFWPHIVLAGAALTRDPLTRELGGTVQAIAEIALASGWEEGETSYPPDYAFAVWSIRGLSLSAADLFDAAMTRTLVDDAALVRHAFSGADDFALGNGDDRALGFDGADAMAGGGGGDRLLGGDGDDRVFGQGGGDRLWGDAGDDVLRGNGGHDLLRAGTGEDLLHGGRGADRLVGGRDAGADRFLFLSTRDSREGLGRDRIENFTRGEDAIDLSAIDAHPADGPDQDFAWARGGPAVRSVWWVDSGDDVLVRGDVTGDRTHDFEIRVVGVASLSASDFDL